MNEAPRNRNVGKYKRGYVFQSKVNRWMGAMIRNQKNYIQLMVIPNRGAPDEGPMVYWRLPRKAQTQNRLDIIIEWSDFTPEELVKIKEIMTKTIDVAMFTATLRAEKLKEAIDSGDDTYGRIYRPAAMLAIREWFLGLDDQGIHERYPLDGEVLSDDDDGSDSADRAIGDQLAKLDASIGVTRYDEPEGS